MTHKEFIELVAEMRAAQKRYFNPTTRTQDTLADSKRLEREVDREIIEYVATLSGKQGRLFS